MLLSDRLFEPRGGCCGAVCVTLPTLHSLGAHTHCSHTRIYHVCFLMVMFVYHPCLFSFAHGAVSMGQDSTWMLRTCVVFPTYLLMLVSRGRICSTRCALCCWIHSVACPQRCPNLALWHCAAVSPSLGDRLPCPQLYLLLLLPALDCFLHVWLQPSSPHSFMWARTAGILSCTALLLMSLSAN